MLFVWFINEIIRKNINTINEIHRHLQLDEELYGVFRCIQNDIRVVVVDKSQKKALENGDQHDDDAVTLVVVDSSL